MRPSETYVRLMDVVEEAVSKAQVDQFDHEAFLKYVPRKGPWEELPASDTTKSDPRVRYIGPARARLLNTNLILGSTWIEAERFKFERRISNVAEFLKQKTIVNANMWTPKQLSTTQTSSFALQETKSVWGSFNWRWARCRPPIPGAPEGEEPSGSQFYGASDTEASCPIPTLLTNVFTRL